jgi:hypothetical protein
MVVFVAYSFLLLWKSYLTYPDLTVIRSFRFSIFYDIQQILSNFVDKFDFDNIEFD